MGWTRKHLDFGIGRSGRKEERVQFRKGVGGEETKRMKEEEEMGEERKGTEEKGGGNLDHFASGARIPRGTIDYTSEVSYHRMYKYVLCVVSCRYLHDLYIKGAGLTSIIFSSRKKRDETAFQIAQPLF